ncbi:MAG TPA: toll/interleukin-1 receptor domain-containing protein [Pyrinomonadaceae bacterium]|nr:toll/interleukin-1 receptor domain-containing protein [Pyrinomonadaceae bacterium]
MSANLDFENSLFISYAHIDNARFTEVEKGWIELLHEALDWRLPQLLGRPVKIWRDRKLGGNDVLNDTIIIELSKAAILLAVITPRYLQSKSCRSELDDFFRLAAQNGGLRIGDKHRVFKVVKTFVPLTEHPPELRDMLGYEFYAEDKSTGRFREYDNEIGPKGEKDKRYWEKFEDLAQDISFLLNRMESAQTREPTRGETIYLAETTSDLREEHDRVKRELLQHGHVVLPDKALPQEAPLLREAVRDYLQLSRLSVHLIGENYGTIPEMETERSIVRLQEELATERGDDDKFSRLIWMPPGLQPTDPRQMKFVDDLQNSFNSHNGSELLQTKLEDLKTIIQTKLTQKPKPVTPVGDTKGPTRIYLICDQSDMDAVGPVQDYLFAQGCEITLPLTEGNEAEVFQDHKDNLLICDAVLIFQGHAGEGWLRMKLRELLKLPGYGRSTPLLGKAIYVAGPVSPPKERFKTQEAQVIKNFGEFDPQPLQPFIARVSEAKGGTL